MHLIANVISNLLSAVELIIIIECLLSWFIRDGRNEIMNLLKTITNPILEPFRKIQYRFLGDLAIDVSPIFAILAIQLIRNLIDIVF